ncbi:MAG: hypothetical protein JWL74_615 [Alphaproteobacteria bacterium]|jgi:hypothetical protein|nr:hypothetical protein [Alphaproteobacteria bacterium]
MSKDDASRTDRSVADALPTRRTMLALGAVAASTVVTVRPAFAQTMGSVINCEIPVPSPQLAGQYIAADGSVVPPGTPGAVAPAGRALTGEEVRVMLHSGATPPGMDPQAAQAYANYIRRLQSGMSGFTCYASLMQR